MTDDVRGARFTIGTVITASLLLLLTVVLGCAWIDGGAERVRDIAQPVMPERPL